jgi:hypothetical protein
MKSLFYLLIIILSSWGIYHELTTYSYLWQVRGACAGLSGPCGS